MIIVALTLQARMVTMVVSHVSLRRKTVALATVVLTTMTTLPTATTTATTPALTAAGGRRYGRRAPPVMVLSSRWSWDQFFVLSLGSPALVMARGTLAAMVGLCCERLTPCSRPLKTRGEHRASRSCMPSRTPAR